MNSIKIDGENNYNFVPLFELITKITEVRAGRKLAFAVVARASQMRVFFHHNLSQCGFGSAYLLLLGLEFCHPFFGSLQSVAIDLYQIFNFL